MQITPELREFLFRYDSHAPLAVETVETEIGQQVARERLTFASINQARVPADPHLRSGDTGPATGADYPARPSLLKG
jgi:hypothetical protein